MFTKPDGNCCLKKQDNSLPSNVIGELTIEDRRYLILLLPEKPQTNLSTESEEVLQQISHFEIQGQYCAIVEAEHTFLAHKPSLADLLTERELQIITFVALGRANKQIARKLHISEWTVATYIRRIFNKLGVDSRAAMVYYCASLIQRNLLNKSGRIGCKSQANDTETVGL